eukprot:9103225-Lingulodinium_polyedra.AAC.1
MVTAVGTAAGAYGVVCGPPTRRRPARDRSRVRALEPGPSVGLGRDGVRLADRAGGPRVAGRRRGPCM